MTQTVSVYAQALYSLTNEEHCSGIVLEELKVLGESFAREPDFLRLLAAPNLSKEERCGILDSSFRGKVHPYVLNFMKLLTERGYIRGFSDCCKVFRQEYNRDHGILEVCAVTAVKMTPEQIRRMTEKLQTITGKTVELTNQLDASCMGGVRLDYDGTRVDDTVAHRLDSVRRMLKDTVL